MTFLGSRSSVRQPGVCAMNARALKKDMTFRRAESVPSTYASRLSHSRRPSGSRMSHDFQGHHLPAELRFTPVNCTSENPEPVKPKRATRFFSSPNPSTAYEDHTSNCRLIGFTPLVEQLSTSSEEDSMGFLGPRNVKAKEVAPCALFYKRADVFVSSEMESQHLLSYSESHYRQMHMRFDSEISINELEYAQQSPHDHVDEVTEPPMILGDAVRKRSALPDKLNLGLVCKSFVKDGLTSMPLGVGSDVEPGFDFDRKPFDIYAEETDSPFTGVSRAGQEVPWAYDQASDPEQATSTISSSGIQSSLWDTVIASSTRATSPVSSIYSSISPSCDRRPIATSRAKDRFPQSGRELIKFSRFRLQTEGNESSSDSSDQGIFAGISDWQEDHGSMADDENDSDGSSNQLESDDDSE